MGQDDFLKIGITTPDKYENEAHLISKYLSENFVDIFHIRKPSWLKVDLARLIENIPEKFHKRLKIHSHFELTDKFDLGGVHLNFQSPSYVEREIPISASIHSLKEIDNYKEVEYMFLSPIFDSISKKNYRSNFDLNTIEKYIRNKNIVALGGVTPDSFMKLKEIGFKGAAMLGYLWK